MAEYFTQVWLSFSARESSYELHLREDPLWTDWALASSPGIRVSSNQFSGVSYVLRYVKYDYCFLTVNHHMFKEFLCLRDSRYISTVIKFDQQTNMIHFYPYILEYHSTYTLLYLKEVPITKSHFMIRKYVLCIQNYWRRNESKSLMETRKRWRIRKFIPKKFFVSVAEINWRRTQI